MDNGSQGAVKLNGLEYFTLRDYLAVCQRRKWLISTVALLIALVAAVGAYFWPNTYKASTIILVEPRKVPEGMVASTVSVSVGDRMATLRQQILSETRLAQVIDEMGLYKELKKSASPQAVIETMQKAIQVEVIASTVNDRGFGAFRVSYENSDAATAAKVTNRLASLFIEENIKSREQQVLGTAEFIDKEVQEAKKELQDKEDALQKVKMQNVGLLPESEASHVQALASLQLDLRSELDAINRVEQQKVYLRSVMSETKPVVDLDKTRGTGDMSGLQADLAAKQSELDQLESRYGPQHPDVLKKASEVAAVQASIDKRLKEARSNPQASVPAGSKNPVIESQIQALSDEVQKRQMRIADLKQQIAYHQGKLEKIPVVQQQIAAVSRDYESAQDHYRKLLDRKFSADMSSDLETRQKGERFVILDPAQTPERPDSPNRLLFDAVGFAVGLGAGLLLSFGMELFDATIKTTREASNEMDTFVLAEIPGIATKAEKNRSKLFTLAAASCNLLLFFAFAAVVAFSR